MATRRDKDLPSHPSMSPRGRPRVPEREVTITDVTQHATDILTDQDFLITTPNDGDFFRYDGTDWVNQAGVDAEDINAGVFGVGDMTVQGALRVQNNVTVFQRFTRTDLTDESWDFQISNGGAFELRAILDAGTTVGRVFNIAHATQRVTFDVGINEGAVTEHQAALTIAESQITDGSTLARLAASETVTGAWTFTNILDISSSTPQILWEETDAAFNEKRWRIVAASGGTLFFQTREDAGEPFSATSFFQVTRSGTTAEFVRVNDALLETHRSGEALRLTDPSATGSPYLSFYQAGTRRAYIQYNDGEDELRIVNEHGGANVWEFQNDGSFKSRGDVIATV